MTIEYGLKIPAAMNGAAGAGVNGMGGGGFGGGSGDLDIEWIVSASSSSSASHISSARSNKLNDPNMMGAAATHRSINTSLFNNENLNGQAPFSRREKRLPWDDDGGGGGGGLGAGGAMNGGGMSKVMRSREGVPLKAFPLMDDSNDFLNSNSSMLSFLSFF